MSLLNAGMKLLGGFLSSRSARRAEQRAIQTFRDSGELTRQAAEKGGFNPLTFLMATGGGAAANGGFTGAGQPAALASQALITGAVEDVGRVLSGEAAQEKKERELAYDLAKLEYDKSAAAGVSSNAAAGFATVNRAADRREFGQVTKYRGGPPPSRPTSSDEPRIRVFAPNGKPWFIPMGVGKRLNLEAGQTMMMGEYTELMGEIQGEGEGIIDAAMDLFGGGNVRETMTGGDLYKPSVPSRPEFKPSGLPAAKPDAKSFWSYFGHSF